MSRVGHARTSDETKSSRGRPRDRASQSPLPGVSVPRPVRSSRVVRDLDLERYDELRRANDAFDRVKTACDRCGWACWAAGDDEGAPAIEQFAELLLKRAREWWLTTRAPASRRKGGR